MPTGASLQQQAQERLSAVCGDGEERLVSASDDFTLFMWLPEKEKKSTGAFVFHLTLTTITIV